MSEGMPQAIEVVDQAEQQGLADLGGQAASGCARGEFAFDGREDAFDLGALAVRFFRKGSEHLIPNGAIRDTPAPRGNDALGSQALPNVLVVGFGVKLRICEHHTDRSAACRHIEQSRQRTRVAPGPLPGALRQQNLLLHIHYNQPLQPRTTRPGPVKVLTEVSESPVPSMAAEMGRLRRRRSRRTVSSNPRSTVSSSSRRRKRYSVV